jgi:hypothetical protein
MVAMAVPMPLVRAGGVGVRGESAGGCLRCGGDSGEGGQVSEV